MATIAGKRVIVTGAGKGLGRAYARGLVQRGARVALIDLDAAAVQAVADEIQRADGEAYPLVADVGDRAAAQGAIADGAARLGGIDALINNAGILRDDFLGDVSEADWQAIVATHLSGTLWCTQAAVPLMQGTGGAIVNTTSRAQHGNPGRSTYAAVKAGIAGFTYSWALELAAMRIRVNAVAPQAATQMAGAKVDSLGRPMANVGASGPPPEAVVPLVCYLISDAADWVSGQVFFAGGSVLGLVGQPALLQRAVQTDLWTDETVQRQIEAGWKEMFPPIGIGDLPYPWYGGVR
jgi:NAD(P)-dependent dehydrogenase (short-subunit alcohol dehydrogenase family)